MDTAVYQRGRAKGMRAIDALRFARWVAEPKLDIDIDHPLTIERDGFDVTLTAKYDYDIGYSDGGYGTFEDGHEDWRTGYWHADTPGAIPNTDRDSRSVSGGRRFYVPSQDRAELVAYYRKAGMSKSVALDKAMEDERAELGRLSEYGPTFVVLTAKVSRAGITLGRASVGGIEIGWSDITRTNGTEYLTEVAEDIIPEAIAEAREALATLTAVPA